MKQSKYIYLMFKSNQCMYSVCFADTVFHFLYRFLYRFSIAWSPLDWLEVFLLIYINKQIKEGQIGRTRKRRRREGKKMRARLVNKALLSALPTSQDLYQQLSFHVRKVSRLSSSFFPLLLLLPVGFSLSLPIFSTCLFLLINIKIEASSCAHFVNVKC